MTIIGKVSLLMFLLLQFVLNAYTIKCRVCLPCEDEYKKLFKITKDEILDNCGVCITAYSTFQGYQMEGRGCLPECPPKNAINKLTPGLISKYDCCYRDLCNRATELFVQYKLLMISCLMYSLLFLILL
ncbi:unnamed protein product [Schistosoma turkestanicum]|nr:unnamed protein product [Schistosoma turkestanicum]